MNEPCPHCDGTGQRIVPPPPEPQRGCPPGRNGKGRRHGFISTYSAGCRCAFCRAAWREYRSRERGRRKETAA